MKTLCQQMKDALKLLEGNPHLADSLSEKEKEQYRERERERMVRLHSFHLEKYLQSEEGLLVARLFKQVWESSSGGRVVSFHTDGWIRWRVFLYKSEPCRGPNRMEIIWFGGNGLELCFQTIDSHDFRTAPVTARDLITRMSLDDTNFDRAGISRPEQIVPFIRLNAMDLVRYLNR